MFRKLSILMKAAFIAGLFAMGMAIPAYALSVDQTKIVPARNYFLQEVHYYRLTINFNDPRIATGQLFGGLPNGSYIMAIDADVTTAFNAGTTNAITIGITSASANEVVASGITAGTIGVYHLTTAAGLGVAVTGVAGNQTVNGVPLYAKYAQTGTAATAGSVTIVITYMPNNDM